MQGAYYLLMNVAARPQIRHWCEMCWISDFWAVSMNGVWQERKGKNKYNIAVDSQAIELSVANSVRRTPYLDDYIHRYLIKPSAKIKSKISFDDILEDVCQLLYF